MKVNLRNGTAYVSPQPNNHPETISVKGNEEILNDFGMFEQKDPNLKSIDPSSSIVLEGSMGRDVFEEFPAEMEEASAVTTLGFQKHSNQKLSQSSSSMVTKSKKTSTDKSHKHFVPDRPCPLRSTNAWLEDSENPAANDLIKTEIPAASDINKAEDESQEQNKEQVPKKSKKLRFFWYLYECWNA